LVAVASEAVPSPAKNARSARVIGKTVRPIEEAYHVNLSAVRVFVRNVAEAKTFYGERLGLKVTLGDLDHGVCMFDAGGAQLVVESVPEGAPVDEQILVGRFTGLSFAVDNIVAKHRDLLALGVEFSGAPEQQYWGGWLATFKDPAGNELQLVQAAP
jgi:predicted enzyme related to lactoylglutathione lyase